MRKFDWVAKATALSFVGGCALVNNSTSKTSSASTASASVSVALPTFNLTAGQTAVAGAQGLTGSLSSVSSFQMPIGNNFQMPIGNNFQMPIGNNFQMPIGNNLVGNSAGALVGNSAGAYRLLGASLPFPIMLGMVPLTEGTVVATGMPPANAEDPASQSVSITGGNNGVEATSELTWWATGSAGTDHEGYQQRTTYTSLRLPASTNALTGTFTTQIDGSSWNTEDASADFTPDHLKVLGLNMLPDTMNVRVDAADLLMGGNHVARFSITQKYDSGSYEVPVLKQLASFLKDKDPGIKVKTGIQIPTNVRIAASFMKPDLSGSMAVNLIASGSLEARKLEVSGWLHPCSGANGCTASDPAVAVANGQSGEIREDFSMDFSTLASHLIYTRPAGSDTYGYRYSIYYDYAANLLVGAKSALTGDLVLLNQQGNPVPGGKLADLKVGADNNIEIDYVTGATASWKL